MKTPSKIKTLLDVQLGTRSSIEKLENHQDNVLASLMVMLLNSAALLPLVKTNFSGGTSEKINTTITQHLVTLVQHLANVADEYMIDFPEYEDMHMLEGSLQTEMVNDVILLINNLIGEVCELMNVLFLDPHQSLAIEEPDPDDIEACTIHILVHVKLIAEKQGIDMSDVFLEV